MSPHTTCTAKYNTASVALSSPELAPEGSVGLAPSSTSVLRPLSAAASQLQLCQCTGSPLNRAPEGLALWGGKHGHWIFYTS
jgi:hypothetical protein